MSAQVPALPTIDEAWKTALDALPTAEANNGKIPAFFFAHGSKHATHFLVPKLSN
jgi:hypothetical protein